QRTCRPASASRTISALSHRPHTKWITGDSRAPGRRSGRASFPVFGGRQSGIRTERRERAKGLTGLTCRTGPAVLREYLGRGAGRLVVCQFGGRTKKNRSGGAIGLVETPPDQERPEENPERPHRSPREVVLGIGGAGEE